MLKPLSVLLCALALMLAACGDDDTEPAQKKEAASPPAAEQKAGCKDVAQPPPRADGGQKKPQKPLAADKTYEVDMTTSCGAFTIRLDQKTSPNAAASFVAL